MAILAESLLTGVCSANMIKKTLSVKKKYEVNCMRTLPGIFNLHNFTWVVGRFKMFGTRSHRLIP